MAPSACCKCDPKKKPKCINLHHFRFNQATFSGRFKELYHQTNPLYILSTPDKLNNARCVINRLYCDGDRPCGYTDQQLWELKSLYDSAFDGNGQYIQILARPMYFVPMKLILFGGMLCYYKSKLGLITWQLLNQAYNTNFITHQKNAPLEPTRKQIKASFVGGSLAAAYSAVALRNHLKAQCASKLARSLVPFVAVAIGHFVSIPLLRAQELRSGKPVFDHNCQKLGHSHQAAHKSVNLDILSKTLRAAPPLILTPYALQIMRERNILSGYPRSKKAIGSIIILVCLAFVCPAAGACFQQLNGMKFNHLEHELRCKACKRYNGNPPDHVCYCAGSPLPF